jgi:hypothetical protein
MSELEICLGDYFDGGKVYKGHLCVSKYEKKNVIRIAKEGSKNFSKRVSSAIHTSLQSLHLTVLQCSAIQYISKRVSSAIHTSLQSLHLTVLQCSAIQYITMNSS